MPFALPAHIGDGAGGEFQQERQFLQASLKMAIPRANTPIVQRQSSLFVEKDTQVAGESVKVLNQVELLQFPHSCGRKLIGWNPLQKKSGLFL